MLITEGVEQKSINGYESIQVIGKGVTVTQSIFLWILKRNQWEFYNSHTHYTVQEETCTDWSFTKAVWITKTTIEI